MIRFGFGQAGLLHHRGKMGSGFGRNDIRILSRGIDCRERSGVRGEMLQQRVLWGLSRRLSRKTSELVTITI